MRPDIAAGRHIDLRAPRGYYLDYSALADHTGAIGPGGVPLAGRVGVREVYSPAAIARYALGNLELYLEHGSEERRRRFEEAGRWLIENIEIVPGSFGGWAMPDPPEAYRDDLSSGWFSGAAHAECVSVLVRASALLRMDGALESLAGVLPALESLVEEGGFLREIGDAGHEGGLASLAFIEEYPIVDRPSMVLAGHVRAMWALYDAAAGAAEPAARLLFDRCARGLLFVLDRYDVGYWTRSDLDDRWRGESLADPERHEEHVIGMRILFDMTGEPAFDDTAGRWAAYGAGLGSRLRVSRERIIFGLRNHDSAPREPDRD
jgi:hypothetical protein